jgi:hypothetical protein
MPSFLENPLGFVTDGVSSAINSVTSSEFFTNFTTGAGELVESITNAASQSGGNQLNINSPLDIFKGINQGGKVEKLAFPNDLFDGYASNSSRVEFDFIGGSNHPKLEKTIALYMPPGVIAQYTAMWQDESLGGVNGAFSEVATQINQIGSNFAQGASGMESGFNTFDTITSRVIGDYKSRSVVNPNKALLYQGHAFRSLDLSFELFARMPSESDTIQQIIESFKVASHPSIKEGTGVRGSTFNYPDAFLIRMMTTDRGNKYMFNFGPCVCTNMSANYGPQQSAYYAQTGAPVQIQLNIQFQEIFMLTKEYVKLGW